MARLIAYFLLLINISCLYNSRINSTLVFQNTLPLKWCSDQILVHSGETIPDKFLPSINKSIEYWNLNLIKRLLINIQRLIAESPNSTIIILTMPKDLAKLNKEPAAVTFVKYMEPNCINQVTIYINETSYGLDINMFETIIRHELGHALGLEDTSEFNDLMFHTLDSLKKHPATLSNDELKKVKNIYNKEN